jgi:hypothetical protein
MRRTSRMMIEAYPFEVYVQDLNYPFEVFELGKII